MKAIVKRWCFIPLCVQTITQPRTALAAAGDGTKWSKIVSQYICLYCRCCCELLFSYSTCFLASCASTIRDFLFFYDLLNGKARTKLSVHGTSVSLSFERINIPFKVFSDANFFSNICSEFNLCCIFVLCTILFNTVDVCFLFGRVSVQRVSENLLKTQKRALALPCL